MNKNLETFIKLCHLHNKNLKNNPENYKENNKIALEINNMGKIIEKDSDFLDNYFHIIDKNIELSWIIAIRLRKYNWSLSYNIYDFWYNIDKQLNWKWKFLLDNWGNDQKEIDKKNKEKIETFNKWKEENKEEYRKIISKIDKVINTYKDRY